MKYTPADMYVEKERDLDAPSRPIYYPLAQPHGKSVDGKSENDNSNPANVLLCLFPFRQLALHGNGDPYSDRISCRRHAGTCARLLLVVCLLLVVLFDIGVPAFHEHRIARYAGRHAIPLVNVLKACHGVTAYQRITHRVTDNQRSDLLTCRRPFCSPMACAPQQHHTGKENGQHGQCS